MWFYSVPRFWLSYTGTPVVQSASVCSTTEVLMSHFYEDGTVLETEAVTAESSTPLERNTGQTTRNPAFQNFSKETRFRLSEEPSGLVNLHHVQPSERSSRATEAPLSGKKDGVAFNLVVRRSRPPPTQKHNGPEGQRARRSKGSRSLLVQRKLK